MPQSGFLFSSKRLGFRLIEDSDFGALVELDTDPEVRAHFPEGVLTPELIRQRIPKSRASFRDNGFGDFAVVDLASGQFTGRAGFARMTAGEIEVGYVILRRYWGRGLAQESLRALLAWAGDNLDVPRIVAYAPRQHAASFNVMKKSGMRYFKTEETRGVECDFFEYPL